MFNKFIIILKIIIQSPKFHMQNQQSNFMARVAINCERFEDMMEFFEQAITSKRGSQQFTADERNLINVGFKTMIGPQRRAITKIQAVEQNSNFNRYSQAVQTYKKRV